MASPVQPSPLAGEYDDWLSRLGEALSAREWSPNLLALVEKLGDNEPLDLHDGMILYNHQDLPNLVHWPMRSAAPVWLAGVFQFKRSH